MKNCPPDNSFSVAAALKARPKKAGHTSPFARLSGFEACCPQSSITRHWTLTFPPLKVCEVTLKNLTSYRQKKIRKKIRNRFISTAYNITESKNLQIYFATSDMANDGLALLSENLAVVTQTLIPKTAYLTGTHLLIP